MTMESPKPERLLFPTYLQMLRNSPGTKMFRSLFVRGEDGRELDVMQDGIYSCAYFVSAVLTLFGQAVRVHGTIASTVADLREHGWQEADAPQPGDVLVWEALEFEGALHEHIGFYLGDGRAVSTSYKLKEVTEHAVDAGGRRLTTVLRQAGW